MEELSTHAVSYAWAAEDGADVGCADFTLTAGQPVTVSILSRAKVATNTLELRSAVGASPYELVVDGIYPVPSTNETRTYAVNSPNLWWSQLAVAAWAIYHRTAGLSDETLYLYSPGCVGGGGNRFTCDADNDGLTADECGGSDTGDTDGVCSATDNRYVLVHELGHAVFHRRNEGRGTALNYDFPEGGDIDELCNCYQTGGPCTVAEHATPHEMQSKEFVSTAFHEGFAHFYAAATFNRQDQSDCFFNYYKRQNYDLDTDKETVTLNCDGIPERVNATTWMNLGDAMDAAVSDHDYLSDSNDGLGCGSDSLANRATEYDFLRFFWDLYTDEGWSLTDIADVADLANPHAWIGALDFDWTDPLSGAPNLPGATLVQVLDDRGNFTQAQDDEWTAQAAVNGVDR